MANLLSRRWMICVLLLTLLVHPLKAQDTAKQHRLQWWKEARFGMFLHWGLYSVAAGEWKGHAYKGNEHFMLYERIPLKEYGAIAQRFNPTAFDADEWVKMAHDAGMKYIVITVKHHDGFAMYQSPSSNYNVVKMSPYAKDPVKLLAAACKKYHVRLCFYYSLGRDWEDPDVPTNWPVKAGRSNTWDYPDEDHKDFARYFERKVKPQMKELLTQYGPVGVIWFDTPELISKAQSKELATWVHSLQPDCIINSRIGNGMGDFKVSEQQIADKIDTTAWESCITMSKGWGYNQFDTSWKTPELIVRQLTEIVSKGGNFLINIGPKGSGAFPEPAIERLRVIGHWMKVNGEAIYGTTPWKVTAEMPGKTGDMPDTVIRTDSSAKTMIDAVNDATSKKIYPVIRFTTKGNNLYVFANSWQAAHITVTALGKKWNKQIQHVALLGSKQKVKWTQQEGYLDIEVPDIYKPEVNVLVFKLQWE